MRIGQNLLRNFTDFYNMTRGIMRDKAISTAGDSKPEEITQYTPDQAQQLEAAANAKDDQGNPLYNVQANEGGTYAVTPTAGGETGTLAPTKQYQMGSKTQAQPFTDDQVQQQRLRNMSTAAANFGDPVQAANYETLASNRQKTTDQEDLRRTLSSEERPGLQRGSYLDVMGPKVMDTYLRQGKVAEAKVWRDFAESEQGRVYADDYAKVNRLVSFGAYDDALPILQKMYDRDMPNGKTVKLSNLGNGQWKVDHIDQSTGQVLESKVTGAGDLAKGAVNSMQPTKMVEFIAQQQGKREHEGALLDRQVQLEGLRQQGQQGREDRRDDRLDTRLDAQSEMLDKRLAAGGGLSLPQQRTNDSIDAARQRLSGMTQPEVLAKTQASTATGRPNDRYDPEMARLAKLANSRKYGEDPQHDEFTSARTQVDSFASKPVTEMTEDQLQRFSKVASPEGRAKIDGELTRRRFAGDSNMAGYQLGPIDPKNRLPFVLDRSGKPVGHYR